LYALQLPDSEPTRVVVQEQPVYFSQWPMAVRFAVKAAEECIEDEEAGKDEIDELPHMPEDGWHPAPQ